MSPGFTFVIRQDWRKGMLHRQVPIKVNAECDQAIAPLVLALNDIKGVITHESCQCSPTGLADIYFNYGNGEDWQKLGRLLNEMAACIAKLKLCCRCVLIMEWFGTNPWPSARLEIKPDHIDEVAASVRAFAKEFNSHKQGDGGER